MDAPDPAPTLSREALRELDALCVSEFGIPSIVLMENAAIGMLGHTLALMRERGSSGALIVAGPGNNGGDGLALARHLHNAGARVRVLATGEPRAGTDALTNCQICRRMGLPVTSPRDLAEAPAKLEALMSELAPSPVIVDALLGTGLDREVTRPLRGLIEAINTAGAPVIAADLPSGMDADTGRALGASVRATLTCAFAGLKRGFAAPGARALTGRVELCPIGAPRELLERLRDRA